jgi:RNA polymerase sigma-70 factor (ECF subfamily)
MAAPGNRELFEQALTDDVYQAAWRYALSLSGQRENAEDLLQESLTKAFIQFPRLRDPAKFKGWLLSIVRTVSIDRRRRERARPPVTPELPTLAAAAADPLAREVAEALAQLPQPQHELLSLFYLDGLSLEETGQVLGVGPRAVRQRLYRARQALRRRLQPARQRLERPLRQGGRCHEIN